MLADHISISIVSHGQGQLVHELLRDLARYCMEQVEVILTLNLPEELPFDPQEFGYVIQIVRNSIPKGFGENHNAAFRLVNTDYFCILNPDVRIQNNLFPDLMAGLRDPQTGIVGPMICNPEGTMEDSARRFPTPIQILLKAFATLSTPEYVVGKNPLHVDWLGGMFIMLRSDTFKMVNGFDESYFLYYEDVDLCWRLLAKGRRALLVPAAIAMHDARRQSHRNLYYLTWHLSSMLRFFAKRTWAMFWT